MGLKLGFFTQPQNGQIRTLTDSFLCHFDTVLCQFGRSILVAVSVSVFNEMSHSENPPHINYAEGLNLNNAHSGNLGRVRCSYSTNQETLQP